MKFLKLITYLLLFSSSQLFAGGEYPPVFSGGYTLGAQWANQNAFNGYLLTLGYTNPQFTVDVGAGIGDYGVLVNGTRPSRTMLDLLGHLGLRSELDQNLFASYGGMWSVRTNSNKIRAIGELTTPYTLGGFRRPRLATCKTFIDVV